VRPAVRPLRSAAAQRGSTTVAGLLVALGLVGLGMTLAWGLQQFRAAERSVEVKGLAEREVPANLAIWTLSHGDADNDAAALYPRIEARNRRIAEFLGERGFEPAEITVGAPTVADRQAQEYGEQGNRLRYFGRATVTVYTSKVDAVRKALGELGELGRRGVPVQGGGEGNGVQYVFDRLNDVKPAMIEEATRNARESAQKFAADSQSTLGRIRRASQGQFSIQDRDASTAHIKRVRVVSTIEYYLQD
jgi:hypothetical protein